MFVDESQDTTPGFIGALRTVVHTVKHDFCLGFFGDPMQKIYTAGAGAIAVEGGWTEIRKPENFRCPQRILTVIDSIRAEDDGLKQSRGEKNLSLLLDGRCIDGDDEANGCWTRPRLRQPPGRT